jgi:hypothetical protein
MRSSVTLLEKIFIPSRLAIEPALLHIGYLCPFSFVHHDGHDDAGVGRERERERERASEMRDERYR